MRSNAIHLITCILMCFITVVLQDVSNDYILIIFSWICCCVVCFLTGLYWFEQKGEIIK